MFDERYHSMMCSNRALEKVFNLFYEEFQPLLECSDQKSFRLPKCQRSNFIGNNFSYPEAKSSFWVFFSFPHSYLSFVTQMDLKKKQNI